MASQSKFGVPIEALMQIMHEFSGMGLSEGFLSILTQTEGMVHGLVDDLIKSIVSETKILQTFALKFENRSLNIDKLLDGVTHNIGPQDMAELHSAESMDCLIPNSKYVLVRFPAGITISDVLVLNARDYLDSILQSVHCVGLMELFFLKMEAGLPLMNQWGFKDSRIFVFPDLSNHDKTNGCAAYMKHGKIHIASADVQLTDNDVVLFLKQKPGGGEHI